MPAFHRRSTLLALGLALGLTACAAPPKVSAPPEIHGRTQPLVVAPEAEVPDRLMAEPDVRRVQAGASDLTPLTGSLAPNPVSEPAAAVSTPPGQSIALSQALYGAITANPDLVSLRQNAPATLEAVEVARRFPTALNPTIFLNPRPGSYERNIGRKGYHQVQGYFNVSIRQPIEFGHQTTHRYNIAKAAYHQARWTITQAELLALVQTYRFFQTAAYRREKLRLAEDLVRFNERLVTTMRKGLEGNLIQAADVALAEVEREAIGQQVEAARQDYAIALADLQNQIGRPENAGIAEPLGEFILPSYIPDAEDEGLIQVALQSRPEIHAARAAAQGACAAVALARGDRIPTAVVGPEYTRDEFGNQFAGFVFIAPIPILNNGTPLVRQREAEYRRTQVALEQVQQRTIVQVKAATAKWNAANRLVTRTNGSTEALKTGVSRMETLFEENKTDITKLLQARQRLIQLENARLDAVWQATQAQADLLTALGAPSMMAALQGEMGRNHPPTETPAPPPPNMPTAR